MIVSVFVNNFCFAKVINKIYSSIYLKFKSLEQKENSRINLEPKKQEGFAVQKCKTYAIEHILKRK